MTDKMMDALFAGSQREHLQKAAKIAPTLSIKDGVGILSFEAITLTTFEAGKAMPSRARWDGKHLRFEPTSHALKYVHKTWPDVIVLKEIPTGRNLERDPPPAPLRGQRSWTPRTERWKHQQRGFDLAATKDEFAYLWDMGTGKTKGGIDDAAFNFARCEIDRVLVIAPSGVHQQWIDDALPVHWPLELGCKRAAIDTGFGPRTLDDEGRRIREDWVDRADEFPNDCKWLAVNIENVRAKKTKEGGRVVWVLEPFAEYVRDWVKAGRTMVILDESHKIKNPQSQRTIACWKIGKEAVKRRIMTGTPIAKGVEDYYAQFRFLDPGIIGCFTFTGFKQQFCVMGGHNGKEIVGYRDTAEFHSRIADYAMRVEKADVLDLPPKLYGERTCDLTPEQRRVLRELKDELMTELSDGSIVTANQMFPRMLRLHQVAQGFLPREDGTYEEFPENKTALLMDIMEQVPDRTVIWCRFTHDIEKLYNELGREQRCIRYYGENKSDRPADKRRWLTDTSAQIFIGNAQAGGTGLDWLMKNGPVSTVIYYSNSFNSIDRWQSEDRTHRGGLRGTVSYYDLITRGSLDRALLRNLKRKRGVSDMSLTELKQIVEAL
jgi:hypothetical protein